MSMNGSEPHQQLSSQDWDHIVRAPKRFHCPVHDAIELHPVAVAITNTSAFQRLKSLHQLGLAYEIYPGANHDRKEHSLGVAHLARKQAEHLRREQGAELGMQERDVMLVELAGLCHDLGHGPFSHVFEREFMPRVHTTGHKWDHEEMGCKLLDYTLDKYHIDLTDYGLQADDGKVVQALMTGDRNQPAAEGLAGKKFLFDIVANKRNSIDVDKFDYLERDSLKSGVRIGIHTQRLLMMARVIEDEICYKWSEFQNICQLFHERARMHQTVYSHRKGKAMEYMLVDAMLLVEPYVKLADKVWDEEQFITTMRDEAVLCTMRSMDPEAYDNPAAVRAAQDLLHRMDNHRLYRYCDETTITADDFVLPDAADITSRMPAGECRVRPEDLIIREVVVDYAMKDKNPLDHVHFFTEPDVTKKFLMDTATCTPMPSNIQQYRERKLRVYCKRAIRGIEEAVKVGFRHWCQERLGLGPTSFPTPLKISGVGAATSGARKRLRYTQPGPQQPMDAIMEAAGGSPGHA